MFRFDYIGKDKTGKNVKGKVEAVSVAEAVSLLREREIVILHISPEREIFFFSIWKRISSRIVLSDIAMFTRQFSTMISAGLPITNALLIIKSQSRVNMKPVVGQILSDVEGGASLSKSLERHLNVFSPVYIALVRAGEAGGILDKLLERLADNLENKQEFESKVKGALIYPIIVVVGMIVVGIIMMVVVIPRITSFYTDFGANLPFATSLLINISKFMQSVWWMIPILGISGFYGLRAFGKTQTGRQKIDEVKFKIPIMGRLQKQIALAEMSRTLGLLVGGGVPILDGLRVVSSIVDNSLISTAIRRASEKVEKGFSLGYALSQEVNVFPPFFYQMLSVGEETGKVDETLLRISAVYEKESENSVRNLTAAIEPIIMIVLGVGVGFMVIAIIMPIYNLTSQF